MKKILLVAASLLGLSAIGSNCTPSPVPPGPATYDAGLPSFDAALPPPPSADACTRACFVLSTLGCAEGNGACIPTCQHVTAARVTDLKPECLAAARSKEAARACGSVACP